MERILRLWIILGIMVLIGCVIYSPVYFPVLKIKIEAPLDYVTPESLIQIAFPYTRKNFLSISPSTLEMAFSQLPWVAKAEVKRIWPGGFEVKVQEKQPIALLNNQMILAEDGSVLPIKQGMVFDPLPWVQSPNDPKTIPAWLEKSQEVLAPLGLVIMGMQLDARHDLSFTFSNQMRIEVGSIAPFRQLERFAKIFPLLMAQSPNPIQSIDLRYNNGFAITFKK